MTSPKHRQPLATTVGFGMLMLQAMTTPFALAAALHPPTSQPTWATGLFLAADLAALAALGLIALGRQTERDAARFAPSTLVLPIWVTIALLSPLQHDTIAGAALYSLYALVVGALSDAPFLTRDGRRLFVNDTDRARSGSGLTLGPIA